MNRNYYTAEKDARCPAMPPGMHPVMRTMVGAQYHRCRLDAGHEPPCVNNEGLTWGRVTPPATNQEAR